MNNFLPPKLQRLLQGRNRLHYLFLVLLLLSVHTLGYAQTATVRGTVTSAADGYGLPGVAVVEKGTNNGTVTNAEGGYSLTLNNPNGTLTVSFIGFATQEIAVDGKTTINVALVEEIDELQEVVVIGYGTIKKSNVTGSIVSVKTEELKQVPSTNVMESLQGKLPGVDITRSSGAAGAGVNVVVRGNRSLTASNKPLFIVDGIQYENIQDLNPNDIASMEVLKDAASTAIYGSRGANGVIIVTTKQGTSGKTRINFNSYAGVSQPVNYPQVFSPQEFVQFNRVANGVDPNDASEDNRIFPDPYFQERIASGGGTNWPDLLVKNGNQQDYQLGVSAGTDKTNMYVSVNYFKEEGVLRNDNLNRYSIRANIDHSINNWLKIGTQNQITHYNINFRRDPLDIGYKINPLLEPYDEDGNYIFRPNGGKDVNPLNDEQPNNYMNNRRTNRIFTSGYIGINLYKNLNFRTNLGLTFDDSRQGIFRGEETIDRNGARTQAEYYKTDNFQLNWENILSYIAELGDHSLGFTAIQSYLNQQVDTLIAQGEGHVLNRQLFYALQNSNSVALYSDYEESKLLSYTGRVQYGYRDKYLLMLVGRADGASQLSPQNRWSFFPSVSAAWRVIEEDFMQNMKFMSDLKIRASYGVAGNYSVPPYATQTKLIRQPTGGYIYGDLLGNPDLGWEITTTYNIGVDFGLMQNRLTGSIDAYQATTEDLLLGRSLPLNAGVKRIIENVGSTENKGLEIGLNTIIIDKSKLRWNIGMNWFANREKILSLATGSNDEANGWFIGYPTQSHFDFEKIGIWQADEVDQAQAYGQKPGDIRVVDQNNDGVIDQTDRVVLGSNVPSWSGNLSSDLKIGGFDIGIQFFARVGQMINWSFANRYDPTGVENSLRHDYWTPDNPTNAYPMPNRGVSRDNTLYVATLRYRDGSFMKLRGATLGYTLPKQLTDRFSIGNLRLYVTGRNLLIFSDFDDYDPERGGAFSNPIPRLIVGGINLEF